MSTATLIQLVGIITLVGLAVLALKPAWRLPVLAFALLAVPGNVDNLLPQMSLDPHKLANTTAPAISAMDLLLGWAVILTVRERRRIEKAETRLLVIAVVVACVMTLAVLMAISRDVEPLAGLRGMILFARIPAYIYLALALRSELRDLRPLLAAIVAGGLVLLANTAYITMQSGFDRFTAATFGRNGLAVALAIVCMASAGLAYDSWPRGGRWRLVALAAAVVGGLALFTMLGTGTRMSLLLLLGAAAMAVVFAALQPDRRYLAGGFATAAVVAIALAGAIAWTSGGGRTVSIITGAGDAFGEAVTEVTAPGSTPVYSTFASRTQFWTPAVEMMQSEPLFGVGPFQWNFRRYELDPHSPVVVADVHNSYLQTGAEYGIPALLAYGALYVGTAAFITIIALVRRRQGYLPWTLAALVLAAGSMPFADLTNSHLFNPRMGAFTWLLLAAAVSLLSTRLVRSGRDTGMEQAAATLPPTEA